MNIAILPLIVGKNNGHLLRESNSGFFFEYALDAVADSEIFDRIVVLTDNDAVAERLRGQRVDIFHAGREMSPLPSSVLPPFSLEALDKLEGVAGDDCIACVEPTFSSVTGRFLRNMYEDYRKGGLPLATVRRYIQPHPAIYFERLGLVGWKIESQERMRDGIRLPEGTSDGDIVHLSACDKNGLALVVRSLRLSVRKGSDGWMAQLTPRWNERNGAESCVNFEAETDGNNVVMKAHGGEEVVEYIVEVYRDGGEPELEVPLVVDSMWTVDKKLGRRVNRLTGEAIQGRQQYPALWHADPLVLFAKKGEIKQMEAMYRDGRVRGYLVEGDLRSDIDSAKIGELVKSGHLDPAHLPGFGKGRASTCRGSFC